MRALVEHAPPSASSSSPPRAPRGPSLAPPASIPSVTSTPKVETALTIWLERTVSDAGGERPRRAPEIEPADDDDPEGHSFPVIPAIPDATARPARTTAAPLAALRPPPGRARLLAGALAAGVVLGVVALGARDGARRPRAAAAIAGAPGVDDVAGEPAAPRSAGREASSPDRTTTPSQPEGPAAREAPPTSPGPAPATPSSAPRPPESSAAAQSHAAATPPPSSNARSSAGAPGATAALEGPAATPPAPPATAARIGNVAGVPLLDARAAPAPQAPTAGDAPYE